jgi:hypothetical protein
MINHHPAPSTSTVEPFVPSRTSDWFDGYLEPVDVRQSRALGYTVPVAITREAFDTTICRDDDSAHVDQNARTVDVLWWAKVALDAHPWPQWVPFTVWPADHPVNLAAIRDTGDMGEDVITITAVEPVCLFTVTGTGQQLPALYIEPSAGQIPVPKVTVSVLHVLLAALLDNEQVVTFNIADRPDHPITLTTADGRVTTLRAHVDGSYSVGLLAEFCDV